MLIRFLSDGPRVTDSEISELTVSHCPDDYDVGPATNDSGQFRIPW